MEMYDELYHHGIRGMKWGVRRYQNSDGSLTEAGRKHYGSGKSFGESIRDYKTARTRQKNLKKARAVKVEKQKAAIDRQKQIESGKIKIKDMTDAEISSRITRLESERRLKQLQQETTVHDKGHKFIKTMMDKVITPAATSAGEQFLRKYLNDVGDDVLDAVKAAKASKDPSKQQKSRIEKLKNDFTELDYKKKISDLKNPKESLADQVRELENKSKLSYLQDDEYQQLKKDAQKAEYKKKIKDPNYELNKDQDKDKNNNGFDDDDEEKDK